MFAVSYTLGIYFLQTSPYLIRRKIQLAYISFKAKDFIQDSIHYFLIHLWWFAIYRWIGRPWGLKGRLVTAGCNRDQKE